MTKLIYIADPMCSWCYGFGPQLKTLLDGLPDTPLEIVVGGLRAYNTKVMDEELKATLKAHWQKVAKVSGLPFTDAAISREGFTYDTEPACRAVVTVRQLAPQASLDALTAIQHAFYVEGHDVTQGQISAEICVKVLTDGGTNIDAEGFLATWRSEEAITATHQDFLLTKHWGISGFPTLVLEQGGELQLVTSGYGPTEALVERLQALVDQAS